MITVINEPYFGKVKELRRLLTSHKGCRIGETAVCSRKLHTVDPHNPQDVSVITNADAGKIFYRRRHAGEIVHIDVFHEVRLLDAAEIAARLKRGVERYTQASCMMTGYDSASRKYQLSHFIDVQTGKGGGRITGNLKYGQRESVKKAHRNHVHISAKIGDADLALVFFLVDSAEQAILEQGGELRQVEQLMHISTDLGSRSDMSAYTAFTDSFLREDRSGDLGENQVYGYELSAIADIMESLEDLQELGKLLSEVARTGRAPYRQDMPFYPREARLLDAWNKMEGYGLVEGAGGRYSLTEEGMELNSKIMRSARELEAELRKQAILFSLQTSTHTGEFGPKTRAGYRRSRVGRSVVAETGDSIAVNETLRHALARQLNQGEWSLSAADLRYEQRQQRKGIDICLLIDASASMLGKRIKAAKSLAEHLVTSSNDRIAVITFQEQKTDVVVPFTRNHLQIRQCLQTIKPGGLTPLASGLRRATEYISASTTRDGLLLLITDGIPTLGDRCTDPLGDALSAAAEFRNCRFRLCCVGLQPNRSILGRVADVAEGSLHIIDELSAQNLLRIAESERSHYSPATT